MFGNMWHVRASIGSCGRLSTPVLHDTIIDPSGHSTRIGEAVFCTLRSICSHDMGR